MPVHRITSVVTTTTSTPIDWAATGSMLSGIGTIIGAVAVMFAAIIGGGTFRAWKRQQLVQRRMDLAERILAVTFKAKLALNGIRDPMMTGGEQMQAVRDLELNGHPNIGAQTGPSVTRLIQAQIVLNRIRVNEKFLEELTEVQARAWGFFGEEVNTHLSAMSSPIETIRVIAHSYASAQTNDDSFDRACRATMFIADPNHDALGQSIEQHANGVRALVQPTLAEDKAALESVLAKALLEKLIDSMRIWL